MNKPGQPPTEDVGRGVVPGRLVRVSSAAARVGEHNHKDGAHEPKLELVRDGDVLQAIDITCFCGKRMRIKCVYGKSAAG